MCGGGSSSKASGGGDKTSVVQTPSGPKTVTPSAPSKSVSYTPGNVGLKNLNAGQPTTAYMKQLGATGPIGSPVSATDSLRMNQTIANSGRNTNVTVSTPSGPKTADLLKAGTGIVAKPAAQDKTQRATGTLTADEIQRGVAAPMGGTVTGTITRPVRASGETEIVFSPAKTPTANVSLMTQAQFDQMYPGNTPARPSLGITSVASGGPGTFAPGMLPAGGASTAPTSPAGTNAAGNASAAGGGSGMGSGGGGGGTGSAVGAGGGTGGTGTGGDGTGTGMAPAQDPNIGPKVCPPGQKLFTFPDGSTTCVPVPLDPQASSPAPMLRPVIAPYHKAAGVASLANYVPYIPGRT